MNTQKILKKFERRFKEEARFSWEKNNLKKYIGEEVYTPDKLALTKTLSNPLSDFLAGEGKRIRPMFFFILVEVFGKNPEEYIDVGMALELLHNATLIIDDIEDDSKLRRGRPTIHRMYGVDVALNAGVALHFLPLRIIDSNKKISSKQKIRLWKIYREEISRVYFGQATDISWHRYGVKKISLENYLEMCRLKTGALMRMSVRMACAVSGVDQDVEEKLSRFSEKMGIIFQIKDDLLDIEGSTKVFGKVYGNDISEGKISLPVVFALQNLSRSEAKELENILLKHTKNKKEIAKAIYLIKKSDALNLSKIEAEKLYLEAKKELSGIKFSKSDKDNLLTFTDSFIDRKK